MQEQSASAVQVPLPETNTSTNRVKKRRASSSSSVLPTGGSVVTGIPSDTGGCTVCHDQTTMNSSVMLLCDGCDGEIHMSCMRPVITEIPPESMFCHKCVNAVLKSIRKKQSYSAGEYMLVNTSCQNLIALVTAEEKLRSKNNVSIRKLKSSSSTTTTTTTDFIGVHWRVKRQKFVARIKEKGANSLRVVGYYDTALEAAKAYDKVAISMGKSPSRLNFPPEGYAFEDPRSSKKRFRGVSAVHNTNNQWQASLVLNDKTTSLGIFNSEVEAAKAYDAAVIRAGAPISFLNFEESAKDLLEKEKAILQVKEWQKSFNGVSNVVSKLKQRQHNNNNVSDLVDGYLQLLPNNQMLNAESVKSVMPSTLVYNEETLKLHEAFNDLKNAVCDYVVKENNEGLLNNLLEKEGVVKTMASTNVASISSTLSASMRVSTRGKATSPTTSTRTTISPVFVQQRNTGFVGIMSCDETSVFWIQTCTWEENCSLRSVKKLSDEAAIRIMQSTTTSFTELQQLLNKATMTLSSSNLEAEVSLLESNLVRDTKRLDSLISANTVTLLEKTRDEASARKACIEWNVEFLKSFASYFTTSTSTLKDTCSQLTTVVDKLKDRLEEFKLEFEYVSKNLSTEKEDLFFKEEYDALWKERCETVQALGLLSDNNNAVNLRKEWQQITKENVVVLPESKTPIISLVQTLQPEENKEDSHYNTTVLYHPGCLNHVTPEGHPECPARMTRAMESITAVSKKHSSSVLCIENLESMEDHHHIAPSFNTLALVHSPHYLEHLKARATTTTSSTSSTETSGPQVFETQTTRGSSIIKTEKNTSTNTSAAAAFNAIDENVNTSAMDTYVSRRSWEVANIAAGTVTLAVDRVLMSKSRNAVALVRPPGHHVGRDGRTSDAPSSGFCLLNNVMVGAAHARMYPGISRVAVLDWDVHHGNGTQELVQNDPDSWFASIHLYNGDFFPGTGHENSSNYSNIVNVALRDNDDGGLGYGSEAFRDGLERIILPKMKDFKPDIIFISAGFDGHKDDIIGGCAAVTTTKKNAASSCSSSSAGYTTEDFAWATRQVLRVADAVCEGRVVSVLEGGYDIRSETNSLAKSIEAHIDAIVTGYDDVVVVKSEESVEEPESLDENTLQPQYYGSVVKQELPRSSTSTMTAVVETLS